MIEIIKKKINLENFKSRIPGLIDVVNKPDNFLDDNASWGKIPISINLFDVNIKYGTMMDLYYRISDVITKSEYYHYSLKNKKWIKRDIDWRDVLKNREYVKYSSNFIGNQEESTNSILGINSLENVKCFYDSVRKIIGENFNGFDFFEKVNEIIGKEIVPYFYKCQDCGETRIAGDIKKCEVCNSENLDEIHEVNVPYFIYLSEVPKLISFMNELKQKTNNCCEKKKYEEYGGDIFYNYLLGLKDKGTIYENNNEPPTIDLPILLTSKLYDLGIYRTYNVDVNYDESVDDSNNIITSGGISANTPSVPSLFQGGNITKTSGESKLRTLRKRKRSVDDNGNELPGIYNKGKNKLELPYQEGYKKNLQYVEGYGSYNLFHCDSIIEMKEFASAIEQTKSYYDELVKILKETQYLEGTLNEPLDTLSDNDITCVININADGGKAVKLIESDVIERVTSLKNKLLKILKTKYTSDNIFCLKQEYKFSYNILYNGFSEPREYKDTFYITYDNPQIEITYALGALFKGDDNNINISEKNPFKLNENALKVWDGDGIWYKEIFPMKKNCLDTFEIDGENIELVYDVIDFESKEITYYYNGIDFPRKKYILCEEIIYKSEKYKENSYDDVIFKDEKMLTINYPLKEKYDVVIDRGASAAFERHLQLSELKTWEDLENYRNGMFLNK